MKNCGLHEIEASKDQNDADVADVITKVLNEEYFPKAEFGGFAQSEVSGSNVWKVT